MYFREIVASFDLDKLSVTNVFLRNYLDLIAFLLQVILVHIYHIHRYIPRLCLEHIVAAFDKLGVTDVFLRNYLDLIAFILQARHCCDDD